MLLPVYCQYTGRVTLLLSRSVSLLPAAIFAPFPDNETRAIINTLELTEIESSGDSRGTSSEGEKVIEQTLSASKRANDLAASVFPPPDDESLDDRLN